MLPSFCNQITSDPSFYSIAWINFIPIMKNAIRAIALFYLSIEVEQTSICNFCDQCTIMLRQFS